MSIQEVKHYKYECNWCGDVVIEARDPWENKDDLPRGWEYGHTPDGFDAHIFCPKPKCQECKHEF